MSGVDVVFGADDENAFLIAQLRTVKKLKSKYGQHTKYGQQSGQLNMGNNLGNLASIETHIVRRSDDGWTLIYDCWFAIETRHCLLHVILRTNVQKSEKCVWND